MAVTLAELENLAVITTSSRQSWRITPMLPSR